MQRLKWVLSIALAAALWVPSITSAQGSTAVGAAGTVTVLGNGSVEIQPDTASFTLGIEVTKPTVPEALEESNAKITSIIEGVMAAGVAAEDIRTANFSVYAMRDYSRQEFEVIAPVIGFSVSNQVTVTVRDIDWESGLPSDAVGTVIGAAIDAGATDIYSVFFSASDPTEAEKDARVLAVENARARAEQLAEISGREVGEVIALIEGVSYSPLVYGAGYDGANEAGMGGGPPVYGGTVTISIEVTVTFELI